MAGLFSKAQVEQINSIAKKSQNVTNQAPTKSVSSINDELAASSAAVQEYFQDSPAILITTKEELHDYVTKAIEAKYVGIDTETTGLDRVNDYIVGASLYYPGGVECYIPMKHRIPIFEDPYKNQLSYEDVAEEFQRFVDEKARLIFANANYDLYMIWKDLNISLDSACYYDVILAWRCLKEDELHNGLKELYNKYVLKGEGDPKRFSDFFSPKLFPYCKPEIAKLYAANDAKITYELFKWQVPFTIKSTKACQKHKLEHIADLIWQVEFPIISICQEIERTGMYLDAETAKTLQAKYHAIDEKERAELVELVQEILETHPKPYNGKTPPFTSGKDFNPRSTLHVKYLCYDLLQLKSKDGKEGTGEAILKEFNLPVTNKIVSIRSLATNISTFVDKLPNAVSSDQRIHANFKQIGAACITGDSIISTKTGYALISDLCKDAESVPEEFIDIQGIDIVNKDQVFECASQCIMYRDVDTIKITCEFGITLEGTPNHPVMVSKYNNDERMKKLMYYYKGEYRHLHKLWDGRKFKQLKDLCVDDLIEIPCNYSNEAEYQKTNLTVGPKRTSKHIGVKVPEYYTEEFAEWLGMYHADGAHAFREGTFSIALSNDNPEVYEKFDSLTWDLFHVSTTRYDKQREKNEVDTYISCMQLCALDNILRSGKRNKRIPEAIWKSPTRVINAYIRGMTLDSTVYRDENGRVALQLSIINQTDIKLVQMHLISQGIWSHISKNVKDVDDMFLNLTFNADNYVLFRDKIGFIESKKVKETEPCGKNKYDHRRVGDSFYVKVKSIEVSKNDVYDLHVPGTHSFVSNCMISHNTGRLSSSDPNLMNIPSRLDDIRHMFRATPASYIEEDLEKTGDKFTITLPKYYQLQLEDGSYKTIEKLEVGNWVVLKNNDFEYNKSIQSIDIDGPNATLTFQG